MSTIIITLIAIILVSAGSSIELYKSIDTKEPHWIASCIFSVIILAILIWFFFHTLDLRETAIINEILTCL